MLVVCCSVLPPTEHPTCFGALLQIRPSDDSFAIRLLRRALDHDHFALAPPPSLCIALNPSLLSIALRSWVSSVNTVAILAPGRVNSQCAHSTPPCVVSVSRRHHSCRPKPASAARPRSSAPSACSARRSSSRIGICRGGPANTAVLP